MPTGKPKKNSGRQRASGPKRTTEAQCFRHVQGQIERNPSVARRLFRNLFLRANHAICVTDVSRRVIMVNREMESLTGFDESELVGQPITALYPKDARDIFDLEALRQGEPTNLNFRINRKRRGDVPVRVRYVLLSLSNGHEVVVETYSDLSDRLRIDQLKNEFVFVAAHELRNPITAIKLLLDIIFDDKRLVIDSILREYLLKVQEANERLSHLVDDLLEVSRTESNRLKINVSPQNISDHVIASLNDVRPTAVSKDVTLRYAPDAKLPLVLADEMKLKEILANLISNATKYNITGGSVTVSHRLKGGYLYTSIADTGIGIKPDDQKRLFEKFWRSEDLAVRAQAGTGLGLFIVRELVQRMGGNITVSSKSGRGTTFTFSLPLVK